MHPSWGPSTQIRALEQVSGQPRGLAVPQLGPRLAPGPGQEPGTGTQAGAARARAVKAEPL